ncbi:MAG TPA: hypothetical protein VLU47_08090 [Blastocatellia bacterium]|nr:hypothetical protein [Blastocatellia bacterium]
MPSTKRASSDPLAAGVPSPVAALFYFLCLAAPVLIAIWFVPWFVTQDGPLHLYNAYLTSALSEENSPLAEFYAPRGGVLPYVGVYKLLAGLMSIMSARAADRFLMMLTSIGFAGSVVWLRWRVAGSEGLPIVVPLVLLLAVSHLWLLGLYSFLLGASLFSVTMGMWWIWRNNLTAARAVIIGGVLALGYLFHIVSTGICVFALVVLAVATPGTNVRKRLLWTAASVAPSVILVISFSALMKTSGGAAAQWIGLTDPLSVQSWVQYLQVPDFISFSFKQTLGGLAVPTDCPFVDQGAVRYALLWPSLWMFLGLVVLAASTLRGRVTRARVFGSEYRGWLLLTLFLFAAGFFGPSAAGHGSILRERVLLLGMVTLVPLIKPQPNTSAARIGGLCLAAGLALQIAFVLDYARLSNRIAGAVMRVAPYLASGERVALLVPDPGTHYAVNPLPSIANQLGVSRDTLVWNNYGPAYYYFPIRFQSDEVMNQWKRVDSLNQLLLSGEVETAPKQNPRGWVAAFGAALEKTDVLVVWGEAPWFDALLEPWFQPEPFLEQGGARAFRQR